MYRMPRQMVIYSNFLPRERSWELFFPYKYIYEINKGQENGVDKKDTDGQGHEKRGPAEEKCSGNGEEQAQPKGVQDGVPDTAAEPDFFQHFFHNCRGFLSFSAIILHLCKWKVKKGQGLHFDNIFPGKM